jgi:poly(A) polymerase
MSDRISPPYFEKIAEYLRGKGVDAYLVGGYVRDLLLGRNTVDVDIAAPDAIGLAREISRVFNGTFVLLDEAHRISRVVMPWRDVEGGEFHLDLSDLRGDIEQDLAQRDFTINAMAISLKDGLEDRSRLPVIDPWGGRRDLDQRSVRALNEAVFRADALRLLRAVRLAAELGLRIDEGTEALIRRDSRLMSGVSGERVREELFRLLALPGAAGALNYMDRLSLLTTIIPELVPAKGVEQPIEHHWDVFQHCIQTVGAVEGLLGGSPWQYGGKDIIDAAPVFADCASYFRDEIGYGSSRLTLLKIAGLLHDIAKPQTRAVDETGRTRFLGHPVLGAEIAGAVLERLRCSNREMKLVTTVVKYHLRPGQLSQEGLPTRRAIYRYFRDVEGAGIDTIYLGMADFLASRGPEIDIGPWRELTGLVGYTLSHHFEVDQTRPLKLLDGNDVMRHFGLKPGPELGSLLEQVKEAQAAGEIHSREEALELVSRILS